MRTYLFFLALLLEIAIPSFANALPSAERMDSGKKITSQTEQALCETNLLLRMDADESYQIFGLSLTASAPSIVMLVASSESISAAVLQGDITSQQVTAKAGELLMWPHDSREEPKLYLFDVARLIASSQLAQDQALRAELAPVIRQQNHDLYWGLLDRSTANAQSPVQPALEGTRRDLLLNPTIISLRREAAGDTGKLQALVARRFVESLAAHDTSTVRDLLDPKPFQPEGATSVQWVPLRAQYAKTLVGGKLSARLAGAELTPLEGKRWDIHGKTGQHYTLELSEGENSFPFVQSLRAE